MNIIRNAMESISGEGCIAISCEKLKERPVSIKMKIPARGSRRGRETDFDPFHTSKETGVVWVLPSPMKLFWPMVEKSLWKVKSGRDRPSRSCFLFSCEAD